VAAGGGFFYAIGIDGTLWGWGVRGQWLGLGDGSGTWYVSFIIFFVFSILFVVFISRIGIPQSLQQTLRQYTDCHTEFARSPLACHTLSSSSLMVRCGVGDLFSSEKLAMALYVLFLSLSPFSFFLFSHISPLPFHSFSSLPSRSFSSNMSALGK